MRLKRWWVGGAVVLLAAVGALAASAAVAGRYTGKTGQKQVVKFSITGNAVQNFSIVILDKCPDGHKLRVTSAYPSMSIAKNGSFGGKFIPVGGTRGEKATIKGKVSGKKVTGSLTDASLSQREGKLCHGHTRFHAHPG